MSRSRQFDDKQQQPPGSTVQGLTQTSDGLRSTKERANDFASRNPQNKQQSGDLVDLLTSPKKPVELPDISGGTKKPTASWLSEKTQPGTQSSNATEQQKARASWLDASPPPTR